MKIFKIKRLIPNKQNNYAVLDKNIPNTSGIYFLFNKNFELLYIGSSEGIRHRLVQHCSDNLSKGITYMKKREVFYYSWIKINNKKDRKLKELILINIFNTKYNKQWEERHN